MSVPVEATKIPPIQKWKPIHTQMVVLHFGGVTNKKIAEEVGRSDVNVYQVLATPQAQELLAELTRRHTSKMMTGIGDKILTLAEKSLTNIEETVNATYPEDSARKVHQDKVGFELLDRVGYGKKDRQTGEQLQLSDEASIKIAEALDRATSARAKHVEVFADYEVEDAEVVENDA